MLLSYVKDNHNANEIIVVPSIGYYTDQYGIGEIPRVTRPAADIQHRLLLRLGGCVEIFFDGVLPSLFKRIELKSVVQKPQEVSQLVEHLFRREAGRMVAILTGIFGIEHLNLAEDVVQEALSRALQTWPFYGVPENPSAWIMRASRNLALDVVRRRKVFQNKQAEIIRSMGHGRAAPEEAIFPEEEISDNRLRLMFVCCHPAIPADAQVALALKTLCGFGVPEISRAFLTTEAAIAKRLARAKQKIQGAQVAFEIPTGDELERRLDSVLQSVYLLFNEGYKASSGKNLV